MPEPITDPVDLTTLTADQLDVLTWDRLTAAERALGTEHFMVAMERVEECGREKDRRIDILRDQVALERTIEASIDAVHAELAKGGAS